MSPTGTTPRTMAGAPRMPPTCTPTWRCAPSARRGWRLARARATPWPLSPEMHDGVAGDGGALAAGRCPEDLQRGGVPLLEIEDLDRVEAGRRHLHGNRW